MPSLLEARQQLVLGVGCVERVERGRRRHVCDGLLLQRQQLRRLLALHACLDELGERRADRVERLGELRRGAARSRGRVVQLVRESRRHRPERGQPLAALLDLGDAAHHRLNLLHHTPMHRRLRECQPAEVLRRDQGKAAAL